MEAKKQRFMTKLTALLRHDSACCRTEPTFTADQSIPLVMPKRTVSFSKSHLALVSLTKLR